MDKCEKISLELLEQGMAVYKKILADAPDRKPLTDPVITPFFNAMRAGGYTMVLNPLHRGNQMRECPHCRSRYSTLYVKDGVRKWGCPHCHRISSE